MQSQGIFPARLIFIMLLAEAPCIKSSQIYICIYSFRKITSKYRKIPNISPGAYIFQRPFGGAYIRRGLSTEGNLRFKTDWASLIVGRKFTVFALFYFVFEGNSPSASPRGAYIWKGDLTEGFFALPDWGGFYLEGLIHEGAYFWNFTVYTK